MSNSVFDNTLDKVLTAHKLHAQTHAKGWVQNKPNTVSKFYNEDDGTNTVGESGKHVRSNHMVQAYDWSKHDFDYVWNSLGLRGPEPNYSADKKILYIGNSSTIGQGVPVEDCFAHITSTVLGYDYINLSDFYVMTDCIYKATKICKEYNPDIIVMNNARFISGGDFGLANLTYLFGKNVFKQFKDREQVEQLKLAFKDVLLEDAQKNLYMLEQTLYNLCSDVKIVWFNNSHTTNRNNNKSGGSELFAHPDIYKLCSGKVEYYDYKKEVVDLARDNRHPGLQAHRNIENCLIKVLKDV